MPHEYEPVNVMLTVNMETGNPTTATLKATAVYLLLTTPGTSKLSSAHAACNRLGLKTCLKGTAIAVVESADGGRATRVEMPKKDERIVQFTNYSKQMRLPFVIFSWERSVVF